MWINPHAGFGSTNFDQIHLNFKYYIKIINHIISCRDVENGAEDKKYKITKKKILVRTGLCCIVILLIYIQTQKKPKPYALQEEVIQLKTHEVKCSDDYQKELTKFPGIL